MIEWNSATFSYVIISVITNKTEDYPPCTKYYYLLTQISGPWHIIDSQYHLIVYVMSSPIRVKMMH